ncbi:hypothetical protein [Tannerella forsythia]|uniref:hypothetical protein n=1 Tax=Tannerella forsythia TaxID=28112 RepID=UPI0028E3C495|nr:hypothetical protein [Tannerella forsythia]
MISIFYPIRNIASKEERIPYSNLKSSFGCRIFGFRPLRRSDRSLSAKAIAGQRSSAGKRTPS